MPTLEAGPAIFSECRRWRYRLTRVWSDRAEDTRLMGFVMLNPSTADESRLDPTLRRCAGYALDGGFDGMVIVNIFAWRDTSPQSMKAAHARGEDIIGPDNDEHLAFVARHVETVVAGWGSHGDYLHRSRQVRALFEREGARLHYLKLTAAGEPSHPLYLPRTLRPEVWA